MALKRCINPLLLTEGTLRNIFELRIMLELGLTDVLFKRLKNEDIVHLEEIVTVEENLGTKYHSMDHHFFHSKIYGIIGNKLLSDFHEVMLPALDYVMNSYKDSFVIMEKRLNDKGQYTTRRERLDIMKNDDAEGYKVALRAHFRPYEIYLDAEQSFT